MAIRRFSLLALFLAACTLTAHKATVTAIPELPQREALDPQTRKPDCVDDKSYLIPGIGFEVPAVGGGVP
ncbi:unnamed protein product [Victoria cruziana]